MKIYQAYGFIAKSEKNKLLYLPQHNFKPYHVEYIYIVYSTYIYR